jgi:hypothetical protein
MESVPFRLDLGVSSVQGVMRLEKEQLAIDWRLYNAFDAPKGGVQSIAIPYSRIESIDYKGGFFGARLIVTVDTPAAFGDFPLPSGNIATLRAAVKRPDRSTARAWAAEAALRAIDDDDPHLLE